LATDQRGPGFARIVNTTVDIGAYEMPRPLVTDTFDRTPNKAPLGPLWINRAGTLGVVNDRAQGTGVNTVHLSTINGASAEDVDLYVSINPGPSQSAGLIARYAGAGDMNYYLAVLQKDALGNGVAKIVKNVNGVVTELAVVEDIFPTGTLRFRVSGSTLQLFLDGALFITVRDASFRTGAFGVRTLGATTLDNFQAWPISIGLDHFNPFTLPDDTALGAPWARIAGTYTVQGNQIQGLDALNLSIIDGATQADVDVRAAVSITGLNHQAGLVARLQNSSNYYLAKLTRTATGLTAQLLKNVAGVLTPLATVAIPAATGKATLRFVATGANLKVYVNSALVIDMLDSSFASGAVGIRSDSYSTLDDFRVLTVTTALSFFDTFDQANGTQLGINWTRRAGNFQVLDNQAVGTLASPGVNLATLVGVNTSNVEVLAELSLTTVGQEVGVVANYSGTSYYLGRFVKTATGYTVSIQKNIAGVVTTLGAVVSVTGSLNGTAVKFQVLGSTLKLFVSGVEKVTRTDGSLITGSVGIRSIGAGTFDNFTATALNFVPFADDFDADTLNPNWMAQVGSYSTTASADKAKGTAALNLMTLSRFSSADVDVSASIVLPNVVGRFASLVARYSGTGDMISSMYLATVSFDGTNCVLSIQKRVNGVTTTLATRNIGLPNINAVVRFTVIGGELKLYFAGVVQLSAFDFSLKTGSAGIRSSLDATFDNLSVKQAS
jgi:hypothetical protein